MKAPTWRGVMRLIAAGIRVREANCRASAARETDPVRKAEDLGRACGMDWIAADLEYYAQDPNPGMMAKTALAWLHGQGRK